MIKPIALLIVIIALFFLSNLNLAQEDRIKITKDVELVKISATTFNHISYHDLPNFQHVPANGLIYIDQGKAFIIDTPWTDEETATLLNWLKDSLNVTVAGAIVTHWHIDCMGGLREIQKAGINSYASNLTREIARSKNLPVPDVGFQDSLKLYLNDKEIVCRYLGAGHTIDNIVVWLPAEKTLFGGCMVKTLGANSLGNTEDADLSEWPKTLKQVLAEFSNSEIVIPGHGNFGNLDLIHHTIKLCEDGRN